MKNSYREIHRKEIKRRMYRSVDRRWDALGGTYFGGVIALTFGIEFILIFKAPAVIFGIFFLLLAYFLMWLYKWLLKKLKEADFTREWLSKLDLFVIALLFAVPNLCFDLGSYVAFSLVPPIVYQNWRLYKYSKPYWRHWYFVTARDYFRMLKDQNPNQFSLHRPNGAGIANARRS